MMEKLFNALMEGKKEFDVVGNGQKAMITRRNIVEGIDILYVTDTYHADSIEWRLEDPEVMGYVVGIGSKRVYGLKYPYSLYAEQTANSEIRAFFGGNLTQAKKSLQYAISAILVQALACEYAEGRCVSVDKLAELRKKAESSDQLLKSVISGKRTYPSMIDVDVSKGTVMQSILDAQTGSRETIDSIVAERMVSDWWNGQKENYAYQRVLGEVYDERIATASPADKLAQSIASAFAAAKEKSAKNVVLEILGKDSNISPYTKRNFPDFTIEGKVIRGRYDAEYPRFEADRLGSPYGFTADEPLKEHYSNRNVTFLDEIYYADIVRISYKGKTLYENPELVPAA